ncbi:MAG: ABC transporter ATP-binding protein [Schaedlerella sp.]|nr:ABC transporter ATP-binding protein [Schaedlerella sp.]
MIEIRHVKKAYDEIMAVNNVTLEIQEGIVFGLLGTNGAGKSTLLRMLAGILKADEGEIIIDEKSVWDNPDASADIFYISDNQFYFPNGTAKEHARFYKKYYPEFDEKKFIDFLKRFGLDEKRKIKTFSKGMKKQISILLGICSKAKYLLCDETFDGLDPVMRQGIKSIFVQEIYERGLTPVIASHNLRELEDICDYIGVLHQGGILLAKDMEKLRGGLLKIQCVLPEEMDLIIRTTLDILRMNRHGKLLTMIVRGSSAQVLPVIESLNPVYCEALPLTLEEIFISEMEVVGYDVKNLIG